MQDVDSAIDDITRIRDQLAASTRFDGFAPKIVGLTGIMAFALAAWQAGTGDDGLLTWIVLAALSAALIGTEAIARAHKLHRAMAGRLLNVTLQRFTPVAIAGAIIGLIVVLRLPEQARLLPGVWQLLMGVGIFAALGNLPRYMAWAAVFYFVAGTICLLMSAGASPLTPWLMGVPFGVGQMLVAAILHVSASRDRHG